jgi:alpha-galactosidase
VAPHWDLDGRDPIVPGYLDIEPATRHAHADTLARSFMHRRLWLNDPDCLLLRTERTQLSADAARTWARTVGLSGGLALVSDDLALLDDAARTVLTEILELGRTSDNEARKGATPTVPDLLDATAPTTLAAAGHTLVTDIASGTSTFGPA